MKNYLPFEKPVSELEKKIEELEQESVSKQIDLSSSLEGLKQELSEEIKLIYSHLTSWETVLIARHPERPKLIDYIRYLIPDYVYFCGDRHYMDDNAIFSAIGTFQGKPIMVIGHNKGKDTKENILNNFGMANPEGYRKAIRLMRLAEKFNCPVVLMVDTQGAYPGIAAEEHGQSEAIAYNLREMFRIQVPILVIVTGEGGSGGALGIGIGDKILMLEYAIYSVISPESCSNILYRDTSRASQFAEKLHITSKDLMQFGLIDGILPEPLGGAHRDHKTMLETVKKEIQYFLDEQTPLNKKTRLDRRMEKFLKMASYETSLNLYQSSS
ncbi:MAG: acetyl-CoA carboxylase carboxyltransferase subunit alpha [Caldisericia bacterium]|nr:acetyl-CoA carboxylase carboxyltransferase subunit alpha [Caldisericia bacterium]